MEAPVLGTRWDGTALLLGRERLVREEDIPTPFPWTAVGWWGSALAAAGLLAWLAALLVRSRRVVTGSFALILAVPGCHDRAGEPSGGAAEGRSGGVPRASFPVRSADLGRVAVRDIGYDATFRIENHGRAPLRILDLAESCTCSSAVTDRRTVEPGGTANLRVRVEPRRAGPKSATVTVRTDDPRRPRQTLTVRWRGVAPGGVDARGPAKTSRR